MSNPNSSSIANARWADPEYIAARYSYEPGKIWLGRDPLNSDNAIGYSDQTHVLVCAGNRSGKGRSFIVNNLIKWPGSVVAYDPKGELPRILAPARGDGDEYCDGRGQDVYVLDPLGKSGVDPKYLAYFDPLAALDPEDQDLSAWTRRIATALIDIPVSGESARWAKLSRNLVALLLDHIVTSERIEGRHRNIVFALRLLMEGRPDDAKRLRERSGGKLSISPMMALLLEMEANSKHKWVPREAKNFIQILQTTPKYFESIRSEATDQLSWLKGGGIERSMTGWDDAERHFEPLRLKTDPDGIAVFIVMPVEDLETYRQWLETVFLGIFAAIRNEPHVPATGHQTLCILDEFLSLGKQEYISTSMDNIAGAGMKLAIIVQNFGKLQEMYGGEIDSFYSNCGMQMFFGNIGEIAADYLSKQLGETEVIRLARNVSQSRNEQRSSSKATSTSTTDTEGGSETQSTSKVKGETVGTSTNQSNTEATANSHNWNQQSNWVKSMGWSKGETWSKGLNWCDTENWGVSEGNTAGRNFGPHIFLASYNDSVTLNKSAGGSHSAGQNETRGSSNTKSGGESFGGGKTTGGAKTNSSSHASGSGSSRSFNESDTKTHSYSTNWSRARTTGQTDTEGQSEGYQIAGGIAESFHKKPLLDIHEINTQLSSFDWEDRDNPAYPGLAVIRLQGEHPFFVRRSNYDQDPLFEHQFSTDGIHPYIALQEQPLLGYQYTSEHIVQFAVPEELLDQDYEVRPLVTRHAKFGKGSEIFEYRHASNNLRAKAKSPAHGKVLKTEFEEGEQIPGGFMEVLFEMAVSPDQSKRLHGELFKPALIARKEELKRLESEQLAKEAAEKTENEIHLARARIRKALLESHKDAISIVERQKKKASRFWTNLDYYGSILITVSGLAIPVELVIALFAWNGTWFWIAVFHFFAGVFAIVTIGLLKDRYAERAEKPFEEQLEELKAEQETELEKLGNLPSNTAEELRNSFKKWGEYRKD